MPTFSLSAFRLTSFFAVSGLPAKYFMISANVCGFVQLGNKPTVYPHMKLNL